MKKSSLFFVLLAYTFSTSLMVGCGGKSNPNADVPADQIAPVTDEELTNDAEYAKEMGGQ